MPDQMPNRTVERLELGHFICFALTLKDFLLTHQCAACAERVQHTLCGNRLGGEQQTHFVRIATDAHAGCRHPRIDLRQSRSYITCVAHIGPPSEETCCALYAAWSRWPPSIQRPF